MRNGDKGIAIVRSEELLAIAPDIRELFEDAFEGDFTPTDFENACGGLHFIRFDGPKVIAHGAVVQRLFAIDDRVWSAGYVEAVSVASSYQGKGLGRQIMSEVTRYCRETYAFALLSSEEQGFYERFGWQRFTGESFAKTPERLIRTVEEDSALMILTEDASIKQAHQLVALDRSISPW